MRKPEIYEQCIFKKIHRTRSQVIEISESKQTPWTSTEISAQTKPTFSFSIQQTQTMLLKRETNTKTLLIYRIASPDTKNRKNEVSSLMQEQTKQWDFPLFFYQ